MGEPSPDGRFGEFGGRYVPESLMPACLELEAAFREAWSDPAFLDEYRTLLRDYGGRPTPVTECKRLSAEFGVRVLLKREDLAHTGSHKINNVIGQALLTRRMGKKRIVAETGAGQHGVASATAAALFGLECVVYMGEVDVERQALNVFRMQLLGAEVRPVSSGSRTLKDAINEAMRDWVANVESTPLLPRLGDGARTRTRGWCASSSASSATRRVGQVRAILGRRPRRRGRVRRRRLERGGHVRRLRRHRRASWSASRPPAAPPSATACPAWCTAASRCCCRTSTARSSRRTRSAPASTIPASARSTRTSRRSVGPRTCRPTTSEVLDALQLLARTEGIIPALESAHAVAWVARGRA